MTPASFLAAKTILPARRGVVWGAGCAWPGAPVPHAAPSTPTSAALTDDASAARRVVDPGWRVLVLLISGPFQIVTAACLDAQYLTRSSNRTATCIFYPVT